MNMIQVGVQPSYLQRMFLDDINEAQENSGASNVSEQA